MATATPRSTRWPPPCSPPCARRRRSRKVSLKTPVDSVTVHDTQDRLRLLSRRDRRPAGGGQHPGHRSGRGRRVRGRDGARATPEPGIAGRRRAEPPDGLRRSALRARGTQGDAHGARPVAHPARSRPTSTIPSCRTRRSTSPARTARARRRGSRPRSRAPTGSRRACTPRRTSSRVTERLSVCGVDITEAEFAEEFRHLQPFLELVDDQAEERVTYFEALTALAYLWFADKPVALGVFEVGMGGTWDATNLVSSDVAVITPIGLDHPELGATLTEVAGEKAGIIKDGKAVVVPGTGCRSARRDRGTVRSGRRDDVARVPRLGGHRATAGRRRPGVRGARTCAPRTTSCSCRCSASTPSATPRRRSWRARRCSARRSTTRTLREALAGVRWPGRLEVVGRQPAIVLDGAHNPAGAEALAAALREFFLWDRLHLVLSIGANKDVAGIAAQLAPLADVAYAARNESERTGDAIADRRGVRRRGHARHGPRLGRRGARRSARGSSGGRPHLRDGSLYTVADARRALGLTT